uniref:Putative DNA binding, helix-turn-helix domain containing protein n=1 Tax=viral metagenome TaxID=1070528 RepID=A0A6M3M6Z6_9ZZZZ
METKNAVGRQPVPTEHQRTKITGVAGYVVRLKERAYDVMKQKGLTQSDVAAKAGVSAMTISRWLSEPTISEEQLEQLCKALGVKMQGFMVRPKASKNSD